MMLVLMMKVIQLHLSINQNEDLRLRYLLRMVLHSVSEVWEKAPLRSFRRSFLEPVSGRPGDERLM
jgi:hypothetical protein